MEISSSNMMFKRFATRCGFATFIGDELGSTAVPCSVQHAGDGVCWHTQCRLDRQTLQSAARTFRVRLHTVRMTTCC